MVKNFMNYMNFKIGQTLDNSITWCDKHRTEIEFGVKHILFPFAIGVFCGLKFNKNESIPVYIVYQDDDLTVTSF